MKIRPYSIPLVFFGLGMAIVTWKRPAMEVKVVCAYHAHPIDTIHDKLYMEYMDYNNRIFFKHWIKERDKKLKKIK
jgi:hypothetical protein